ncbi:MAG TPA: heavy-metal-associated domain-containing protein [Longimicrobiales bacterium]
MEITRIEVYGLPDDDAAARLEKMLTGRTGVPRASIDPTMQLAEVTYDPEHVSAEDIVRWIRAAGYEADFAGRRAG